MALLDPSRYVRANAWMDPDFLETLMAAEPAGCPLPRRDAQLCATMNFVASRTEFAFWALWSAPLLVSTDVANLSAEKRSILTNTEVLAIHNDEAWVGGSRVFNHSTSGAQVWARPLANGDIAVILYNAGRTKESWEERETVPVSVTWDMLRPVPSSQRPGQLAVTDSQRAEGGGASRSDSQQANDDNKAWSKSDKVKVRDLWAGTDLTGTGGQRVGFEAQIAPKDHMMLRLSLVV